MMEFQRPSALSLLPEQGSVQWYRMYLLFQSIVTFKIDNVLQIVFNYDAWKELQANIPRNDLAHLKPAFFLLRQQKHSPALPL
jgi:hypothetical protein